MPQRPPKAWFDRCLKSVGKVPEVDDPAALCGWVWYHHMTPRRALKFLKDGSLRYDPVKRKIVSMWEIHAPWSKTPMWFDKKEEAEKWLKMAEADLPIKEIKGTVETATQPTTFAGFGIWGRRTKVFVPLGERKPLDPDAWRKAMRVSGKMLVIQKAKAGLRKGKQAFTDLVEVAVNVPRGVYDRLIREGYFTEYEKGRATRRGRTKRGTNIFLMRK